MYASVACYDDYFTLFSFTFYYLYVPSAPSLVGLTMRCNDGVVDRGFYEDLSQNLAESYVTFVTTVTALLLPQHVLTALLLYRSISVPLHIVLKTPWSESASEL
jgi:hypothetical protein